MELRDKIRERHGLSRGYGTVWRFLARHRITRKKKTGHASEQEREDIEASREAWFEGQLDLDPTKLVFIDDTSISTSMARRFGWASRGERCRASIPFGPPWVREGTIEKTDDQHPFIMRLDRFDCDANGGEIVILFQLSVCHDHTRPIALGALDSGP
jgi:hypothetical protein